MQTTPPDVFDLHRRTLARARTNSGLERLIYLYAVTYLQDDILVKVDRASMACSLEVRAPFLDVDLVTFLSGVPPRLKHRRFGGKRILKRAMEGRLPPGITARQKKGFGIPVAEWLKGPLRAMLEDELSVSRLEKQGLFQPSAVRQIVSEHVSGRRDHRKQLWTLLVFQLWYRRWHEEARRAPGIGHSPSGSHEWDSCRGRNSMTHHSISHTARTCSRRDRSGQRTASAR